MSRGNRKQVIFEDAHDRRRFIRIMAEAAERYAVEVLTECRMGTHYHVVVRTPRGNLSRFMQYLNGVYAQYSNRRNHRTGHLFGERFLPILVDDDLYLRVVTGYVVMNPVAAGFVNAPAEWTWSSYRATVGIEPAPSYLCLDWLDQAFPAPSRCESQARFERYLTAPTLADAETWLARPAVGSEAFKRELRVQIGATLFQAALPRSYRALHRPTLEELFPRRLNKVERGSAALRAHVVHGYTMAEIARCLGLHPNSVSRIVTSLRHRMHEL